MARWIQVDGKLVPAEEVERTQSGHRIQIMRDLKPFKSPVDGSVISTRRQRTLHNKRNGVVDIGNDRSAVEKSPVQPVDHTESLNRAWSQLGGT